MIDDSEFGFPIKDKIVLIDDPQPVAPIEEITTHGVKYIGSKRTIVKHIGDMVSSLDIKTAIDVFSGTTRVAQYLKQNGIRMVTSDLSWATTCYAYTYVHNRDNKHLQSKIEEMNNLAPVRGWLTKNYTGDIPEEEKHGYGRCFQIKNSMKADAARDWINEQQLEGWEKYTLITSVIHALDAVDNTVGVQQAYLKDWCARSKNDIKFKLPAYVKGPIGEHFEGNALTIDYPECDLAYLDPPYSQHSYAEYYHIWDSIVRWDKPETDLKAKRRVDRVAKHANFNGSMKSLWNTNEAKKAFDALINRLPVKYVLISYSDESLVAKNELMEICYRYDENYKIKEIDYKRNIKSQTGNATIDGNEVEKNQKNKELLILIEKSA